MIIVSLFTGLIGSGNALAFKIGDLKVGGAIRVNYINGDYDSNNTGGPERGDNGGNFEMDTFRVNLDYQHNSLLGKIEYRFYDGYHFLHTGWIGYQVNPDTQIQLGVNRVPFGVGPYGPSNSNFFDLHYYVGLADDMDLGVKYTTKHHGSGCTKPDFPLILLRCCVHLFVAGAV